MRTTQLLTLAAALSAMQAATFGTLYHFTGQEGDGGYPEGNLAIDRSGTIYGTTSRGGIVNNSCPADAPNPGGCGTVFQLTAPTEAGAPWTETVLYRFTGENGDGANPSAGVVIGRDGVLYGTTLHGGTGGGTVFQLKPPAHAGGRWTETVIHTFTGQGGDGSGPAGYLAVGSAGALYGMTTTGGTSTAGCPNGCGIIFQLAPPTADNGAWTESVLHYPSFQVVGNSEAIGQLDSGLTIDDNGALYGVTPSHGGHGNYGTVFKLAPPATPGADWSKTVLFNFDLIDGATPLSGVVIGGNGALYGTTSQGGLDDCLGLGCGTVFELTQPATPGDTWTQTVLCNMGGASCPGQGSLATRVVIGHNGVLYGTTVDLDSLFSLTPPATVGEAWTSKTLHVFMHGTDGSDPAGLSVGPDGTVYGVTMGSGSCSLPGGCGTVFAWVP